VVPVALDQNASIALPPPRVSTVFPVAVETGSGLAGAGAGTLTKFTFTGCSFAGEEDFNVTSKAFLGK